MVGEEIGGEDYGQPENRDEEELEEDEEAEDALETEFGQQQEDSGHVLPLRITGQRNLTGRASPIPGLLQKLRRQPIPEPGASSSAAQVGEEANWTSLMSAQEFPRPPSPPVVLHATSALRRRPPPTATPAAPYEQQLFEFGETEPKGRRRTHPLQGHRRRCVSFSVWRNKTTSSAPGSVTSSGRLQSRHMSLTRREFVTSLRRKARAVRAVLPRIHDVNVIDKWSRAMFPFSFILFNFVYWCYYVFSDWKD